VQLLRRPLALGRSAHTGSAPRPTGVRADRTSAIPKATQAASKTTSGSQGRERPRLRARAGSRRGLSSSPTSTSSPAWPANKSAPARTAATPVRNADGVAIGTIVTDRRCTCNERPKQRARPRQHDHVRSALPLRRELPTRASRSSPRSRRHTPPGGRARCPWSP
jgi:hypothetical protein